MNAREIDWTAPAVLCAVLAACVSPARAQDGPASGAEQIKLPFRAEDGPSSSVFEDVNVYQSNAAKDIARFWTRRQPSAAVDRYVKGTSDAFYIIRLPELIGIKSSQVPADANLIVKGVLRLVRIPSAGYFPEGWQVPEKKKVAFTVYRLTDPDGLGPWRMPSEAESPPKSREPFVGVCGAFRDGRSCYHDPRRNVLVPAGRPWRSDAAAGLDTGVLVEDCTLPYSPTGLVYEFDVTASLKAWASGEVNDGWAVQVSKDTDVSGRGDFLFHTTLAENQEDRPLLMVTVKPRPFDGSWRAQTAVKHPFYRTRDDIARAKQNAEKYDWAKTDLESIRADAEKWAKMSDRQIDAMIPSRNDARHDLPKDIYYSNSGLFQRAAIAYALTGDKRYARPVAVALVRIAQAWRHWPIVGEDGTAATAGPDTGKKGPPYAPAASHMGSIWNDQKLLLFAGIAYDLIHDSGAFEAIGQEERFDAKGLVEQELFRAGAQFLLDHQIGYGNFNGYLISAAVISSLNTGDPDLVHRSVDVLEVQLTNSFFRDGMWFERCGYHGQTCNFWYAVEALRHYGDPPNYAPAKGLARFEDLDPYRKWPHLRTIYRATLPLVYPDKDCLYVNDTSTNEFWDKALFRILAGRYNDADMVQVVGDDLVFGPGGGKPPVGIVPEVTRSCLLPESGFATLRAGEGTAGQVAAMLTYGDAETSHDHTDGLSLGAFGKARELAADLGYTHTYLRFSWSATTAGHNTVLVDGKLQQHGRGDLLFYWPDEPAGPSVQAVEAAMPRAYPGAKLYARCVSVVRPSSGGPYIVDFFRVEGGSRHDFMFHGPATHKQKLTVEGAELKPQAGTLEGENAPYAGGRKGTGSQYDTKDWYTYVTDIRRGTVAAKALCRWEYDDANAVGLAGTFLPDAGAEFFAGTAPSLRLDDGKTSNYTDRAAIDRNRLPIICIRKSAPAGQPLSSTFVSVLEPYQGKPRIREVKRLNLGHGVVGAMVKTEGATQYVFNGSDGRGGQLGAGEAEGVRFRGQFGAASLKGADLDFMCLVGEGELGGPAWQIKHPGGILAKVESVRGDLTGEKDNALVLAPDAPAVPDAFAGQVALLRHRDGTCSAYTIAGIAREGGKTAVRLADQRAFLLSRFVVDGVDGNATLHTVHSIRQSGDGWFAGKWLTCGGKTYRIQSVRPDGRENLYCRGFLVDVKPEDGKMEIKPGDTCFIHAARPGDELLLGHRTFVRQTGPGRFLVRTTAKVTLGLPAPDGQKSLRYQDKTGAAPVVAGKLVQAAGGGQTLVVELDAVELKAGQTTVELVRN